MDSLLERFPLQYELAAHLRNAVAKEEAAFATLRERLGDDDDAIDAAYQIMKMRTELCRQELDRLIQSIAAVVALDAPAPFVVTTKTRSMQI